MNKNLDEMRAKLEGIGYTAIPETKSGIVVGDRIRHVSHQYSEAYRDGTATVRAILRYVNSTWEQDYGKPDIELLVDDGSDRIMQWADYHCVRIEVEL